MNEKKIDTDFIKQTILYSFKDLHESFNKQVDLIVSTRRWEITLLAIILGYAITQKSIVPLTSFIVLVVVQFGLLELLIRGRMLLIEKTIRRLEEVILEEENANKVLEMYNFKFLEWSKISFSDKIVAFFSGFKSPDFLMWNFSLLFIYSFIVYWS